MGRRESGRANATPPLLRRINAGTVLDLLRDGDARRVTEIADETGLSRPTVDALTGDLLRLGLIAENEELTAPDRRARGRPARRYQFRADAGFVLGVDIGAEGVRVIMADLSGAVVAEHVRGVDHDAPRGRRLRAVGQAAKAATKQAGVDPKRILAAGVGTPGIVDVSTGSVLFCNAIPDWSRLTLVDRLSKILGCEVVADNDANLAVVAERWRGVARDCDDVILILTGRRLGSGIVIGGSLVRGFRGGAGELGFLGATDGANPLAPAQQRLPRRGSVQALLSQSPDPAMETTAARWRDRLLESGGALDPVAALEAARRGDKDAANAFRRFLAGTSAAVATMALLLNPELIVVAGLGTRLGHGMVLPLRERLTELTADMVATPPRLELSSLDDRVIALGGVRQALDLVESRLFDDLSVN